MRPHRAHRIGDQVAVMHVEEARPRRGARVRRWRAPRRRGGAPTPPRPSRRRSRSPSRGREDGRDDARPGRHRLGGVAVRHDEARVGIGRRDRFEVEVVVGRLEQPQVGRASRVQELDDAPVVVVRRRHVGGAPPGVVAVHRKRVLLPVERHAEQLGVLHRRVDVVEVHRVQLGVSSCSFSCASCSRRGSVASLSIVGGGHGCDCSHPRRPRNCGSSDIMLASAVVPVRGSPLMSTGPRTGELRDLGMVAVPRLDLEAVDQASPEVADHVGVGRGAEVGVALEALEQHVEALAEVARPEVGADRSRPSPRPSSTSLLG